MTSRAPDLASSSSVAHDLYKGVLKDQAVSEKDEVRALTGAGAEGATHH